MRRTINAFLIGLSLLMAALAVFISLRSIADNRIRLQAISYLSQGKYENARDLYLQLKDEKLVNECDGLIIARSYNEALRLMNAGDYTDAEAIFLKLSGFRDADELVMKCRYLYADAILEGGDTVRALELFKALGDYSDSTSKYEGVCLSLYTMAGELIKGCNYSDAEVYYLLLGDYRDSPTLAARCKARVTMTDSSRRIIDPLNVFAHFDTGTLYIADSGYVFIPSVVDADTDFMLFFPGGRDIEEPPEYVYNYIGASDGRTIALFLYRNGLYDWFSKADSAVLTLRKAADECGISFKPPLLCGSSMGAYPAMHTAAYYHSEYGLTVSRVICFDAGVDWEDETLLLSEDECIELASAGTQLWLFEQDGVGMDRSGISSMVCSGCSVTVIACANGEHNAILYDALDCGMIEYALNRHSKPDNGNYRFIPLTPFSTYPE